MAAQSAAAVRMADDTPFDPAFKVLLTVSNRPPVKSARRGRTRAERLAKSAYPMRRCAHCNGPYKPIKQDQSFCCPEHKRAFHNLRQHDEETKAHREAVRIDPSYEKR